MVSPDTRFSAPPSVAASLYSNRTAFEIGRDITRPNNSIVEYMHQKNDKIFSKQVDRAKKQYCHKDKNKPPTPFTLQFQNQLKMILLE